MTFSLEVDIARYEMPWTYGYYPVLDIVGKESSNKQLPNLVWTEFRVAGNVTDQRRRFGTIAVI